MLPPPLSSTANHPIIRSQTKVETQNFASPVPPMPTYARYNTLPANSPLPRETQDFASLHAGAAIIINSNISYYTQSNKSRDAKSCVSRPVPYQHTHAIIRWHQMHSSLVRRKILRLYILPPPLSSTQTYPIIRSQTKVETQNLASPVHAIPTYARYNTLPANSPLPCRDAKSCVSRPTTYQHTHDIIRWHHTHFSLVRRKILRLYKAGALIMHAYIPHIRRAFLSACRDITIKTHASS